MDPQNLNQNSDQILSGSNGMTGQTAFSGMSAGHAVSVNPATAASPAVPAGLETPQPPTPDFGTSQTSTGFGAPLTGSEMPQVPNPVNPVVNPGARMNPNVAMPALDPSLVVMDGPSNMSRPNVADVMVGATDPITMPNLPKAPDPVEEELKAPMMAAAPVPGSIGSAISVPAEQPQMPNVAFNDPAMQQGQPMEQQLGSVAPIASAKKKMSKQTLIMICAIAGIAVVALVIVLIMMMNG